MSDSIFTKIIAGELPSHKVFEDDMTYAFMDIFPIQSGHVVVVSKRQVDTVFDLKDQEYQALMATVKRVADRLRRLFPDKKRIAVIIEGLDVDHPHVKVFPIDTGEQLRAPQDTTVEPNHAELERLATLLRSDVYASPV